MAYVGFVWYLELICGQEKCHEWPLAAHTSSISKIWIDINLGGFGREYFIGQSARQKTIFASIETRCWYQHKNPIPNKTIAAASTY